MSFRITVTEIKQTKVVESEYQQIADSGNKRDEGAVYGYVDHEVVKDISTEVYRQESEDLDLVAVINAVNKKKEN